MWLLDELKKRRNSEKTAIILREQRTSYKELWKKSEIIAGYLEKHGYNKNKINAPILIYGNKENDVISVMHAALKVGLPYVPVDTTYPVERLIKIAEQTDAKVIFNFSNITIEADTEDTKVFTQSDIDSLVIGWFDLKSNEEHWVAEDDICYILFTSGSTGEPKGVPIRKSNIMNFVRWVQTYALIKNKEDFIAMNQVSYSFDVSVFALYVYLPMGHSIFSIDKEMLNDINELFRWLPNSKIAVWVSTPSFIELCCFDDKFSKKMLPELKRVILAGEVLTKTLVKSIKERFEEINIVNGYGPTECTVLLTACEINEEMLDADDSLPIGYLLDDATYFLSEKYVENEKEIGLFNVISASVGHGYYNNTEITNQKFTFYEEKNLYGYNTGDLVYLKNNLIYYIGRQDSQIKLNGYRMELDDISENINKLNYVSNNIVLPIKEEGKVKYLVAYVLLKTWSNISNLRMSLKLKKDLANKIPVYMVPKKVIFLDRFPLNVNGKIDRKKLLEMTK